jgi:hypothetical protein
LYLLEKTVQLHQEKEAKEEVQGKVLRKLKMSRKIILILTLL